MLFCLDEISKGTYMKLKLHGDLLLNEFFLRIEAKSYMLIKSGDSK